MRDGRIVGRHRARRRTRAYRRRGDGRPQRSSGMFPAITPAERPDADRGREPVSRLTAAFNNVSFTVHAGEILGIAGLIGAGRTELVRAIAGADPIAVGHRQGRWQAGADVAARPMRSAPASCWYRKTARTQGVMLDQTIGENLALGNFDHVAPRGWVWPQRRAEASPKQAFGGSASRATHDQPAGKLSGGNQQKVVIAKWIARPPQRLHPGRADARHRRRRARGDL